MGVDVLVPFPYQELTAGGFDGYSFNLGDIFVEPITLSWHPKQFDFAVGYGFWAPSGNYSPTDPVSPGKGFWSQMLTAGATWYPDEEKTWSVSVLNRYEFNQQQQDTDITPGQYLDHGVGHRQELPQDDRRRRGGLLSATDHRGLRQHRRHERQQSARSRWALGPGILRSMSSAPNAAG